MGKYGQGGSIEFRDLNLCTNVSNDTYTVVPSSPVMQKREEKSILVVVK